MRIFFSSELENIIFSTESSAVVSFGHMANGRILLECIGLQMFNYQLTYLPTLKMRFCMIKKKTALEFVLSQLCTRYRMFSEAAGLMNNKAVALPGLGSLPWPVLS